jgi:hypothetical protein
VNALGVRAAEALQLSFDPVCGVAIALRALAAIAKLGQPLDGGLVFLEFEPAHQLGDVRVGRRRANRRLTWRRGILRRILDRILNRILCRGDPAAGGGHESHRE